MWRPGQDVKVAPTDCVTRAMTGGARWAEPRFQVLASLSAFEAEKLFLIRNIALVWPKRSLFVWILFDGH